jgi:glycoside/pentoside/hexuronide:cation symporter, GPH family
MVYLGLLRMPLALLELPLFVLLPKLYNELFGLSLATVGTVLLGARLVDAALDPFLGVWLDRYKQKFNYRFWIAAALPLLLVGFAALLWAPEAWKGNSNLVAGWLGVFSIVTYIAYSIVSISYQAWGAQWGATNAQRAKVTSIREACGLGGVLIAALWLSPDKRYALFGTLVGLAAIAGWALTRLPSPSIGSVKPLSYQQGQSSLQALGLLLKDQKFCWLLTVFAINGIATAIPATLVLFFIADVVGANAQAPMFLASYFLAGACGMPIWTLLARRFGLRNSWLIGMLFAVMAFVSALSVERGDAHLFLGICIVTGLALGADLAMPPALLAMIIANNKSKLGQDIATKAEAGEATYFGLWNLVTKLNLAIAAGLGLPLLQWLGYQPQSPIAKSTLALSLVYAALPCALKLIAGTALMLSPLKENVE